MQQKIITIEEALHYIKSGSTLMVGGFLGVGTPETIIDAIVAAKLKDLTLIANDTAFPDKGVGKLIFNRQVTKVLTSHIGTNPETGKQMQAGETEVKLIPQGTLAEQIRAGGAGLGGILTPTGVGTIVEEGKTKIEVDGQMFLLEKPIRAEIALIKGSVVDEKGNVYYNQSTRNFNPLMAMAADIVIVEAEKIVSIGEIDPNEVMTPGLLVDFIVGGKTCQ